MNFSPLRVTFGIIILAALGIVDLVQHGRQATRWREYAFLAFCVAIAILYGMLNDLITCRISWEYFYYGKMLSPVLGPDVPPDPARLSLQAIRIGAAATWWAGLVIGAAILMTNNPSRRGPQLSYKRLAVRLPAVVLITVISAAVFGFVGAHGALNWISPDFQNLADTNLWRPHRFMAVYGIHLGGYIGGVLAVLYAIVSIARERRSSLGLFSMPAGSEQFRAAIEKIDAANSEDPIRVGDLSAELLYSRRMTDWLARLDPNAGEALQLAARAQHIRRWLIPRSEYPITRAGYHQWRTALYSFHADTAAEILRQVGYDETVIARVRSLLRKEKLKADPKMQTLEDVACLVFLENYFADFAPRHDEEKIIGILRRTWKKMSDRAHAAALELELPPDARRLVEKALKT